MKLIIGLGNPGERYKNTRHNAGFLVADELQKMKLPVGVVVRKSDTFMNDSGSFVKKIVDKYKPDLSDLYIIHDDLDIPLGSYKIQFGVGPKVHNGVNSVEIELGAKDFWRIRVGVDSRNPNDRTSGEEYVLQDFSEEEKKILDGIIEKICKETNHLLQ
ncbi:MAG TPA: aminoacyl-tRNA hydrolase [Candidatus Saccharimonadales bacterium]|jgi:PTH1 family peptidyl-tRNA hydrolase|nr:aminoacyl-tRNA hydrolase [Candidatus Saccharimonadales bacterium]